MFYKKEFWRGFHPRLKAALKAESTVMVQILDALPAKYKRCGYMNATSCIQIIRIVNIPHWYFERVVFPQQRLLFETLPEAELEIYTREMVGAMLTDKIFCARLQITDEDITEINPDKLTLN